MPSPLPSPPDSEDSEAEQEEHVAVGAVRPQWALTPNLMQNIRHQAHQDPDAIFGAVKPIQLEGRGGGMCLCLGC
jgi:hypothetical protein